MSTQAVLAEIERERNRQDAKWGQQDHDDIPARWKARTPEDIATLLGGPTANLARSLCEFENEIFLKPSWAHVLIGEVAEGIEQAALGNVPKLREELIQVAAVATAWIEAIDRRTA